ncbi:MAG: hypothetical protein GY866_21530 [Proteobacteria bacterium]|nr:hypothetical protein [Pseudomonadota bacterium]
MNADLLIVSADDFPENLSLELRDKGFSCIFSRGGIKTREILGSQKIDVVIWLFFGHEKALAKDLLEIFNKNPDIPIVFITQSYEKLNFAEEIEGLFANLDLNDDLEDILKTVESACNRAIIVEEEVQEINPPEIDFKNAVSQMIRDTDSPEAGEKPDARNSMRQIPLWNAVDKSEKKLLSEQYQPEKKHLLSKIKGLFD